jgi:hypothetical protein
VAPGDACWGAGCWPATLRTAVGSEWRRRSQRLERSYFFFATFLAGFFAAAFFAGAFFAAAFFAGALFNEPVEVFVVAFFITIFKSPSGRLSDLIIHDRDARVTSIRTTDG